MKFDAVVVGGSYAGLSGAFYIARARRSVLVIDGGKPRNRFSDHSHGVIAQDGRPGSEILAAARKQVLAYPTVTLRDGLAIAARRVEREFVVELDDGSSVSARRVLLATGVSDSLPETPGLRERWGKTVLHCPYCHGYEVGGGAIGVLAMSPMAVHHASLIADWGDVTLFTDGKVELDSAGLSIARRRNITIEASPVRGLEGRSPHLDGVRLEDGRLVPVKAVFVGAPVTMNSSLAAQLGCEFEETPIGPLVRTDAFKLTSVSGVYAAGDMAKMAASISNASADGMMAGVGLHQSLIAEALAD